MSKEEQNEQSGERPENPLPEQKQPRPGLESEIEPRPQFLRAELQRFG